MKKLILSYNYVQIGNLRFPLVLSRGGLSDKESPNGRGVPLEFRGEIPADLKDTWDNGGIRASIGPVHMSKCPSVKLGKKHGPCNCGAHERFKNLVEESGESWILEGFETAELQFGFSAKK